MRVKLWPCLSLVCMWLVSCSQQAVDAPPAETAAESTDTSASMPNAASTSASAAPIASDGTVAMAPENTQIQFVGTHVGDEPKPRVGVFTKFSGTAAIDTGAKSLRSAAVEIDVDSLVTQFDKLTNHLKSPDFFDAREHPTARFETTSVTPGSGNGEHTITGQFTLMGTTKELSFPAQVQVTDDGLRLDGKFMFNRSDYGMHKMREGVEDPVEVTVTIGQPTKVPEPAAGP